MHLSIDAHLGLTATAMITASMRRSSFLLYDLHVGALSSAAGPCSASVSSIGGPVAGGWLVIFKVSSLTPALSSISVLCC